MTDLDGLAEASLVQFEHALVELAEARYDLTLFVNGASALSARAVTAVRIICDNHLRDRYRLEIVDVTTDPTMVIQRGVIASPTLIKDHPLPRRVLVGDLSDTRRVLQALNIQPAAAATAVKDAEPVG